MASSLGKVLVTGASGQLGSYLMRELRSRDLDAVAWNRRLDSTLSGFRCQNVNLCDSEEIITAFRAVNPDTVIHAGAMSGVGDCFRDPTTARHTNTTATSLLAELAERRNARMLYVSTDLVFNGEKQWYTETDCPEPLSVYGQTKTAAERTVLEHARHLVVRVSLLYGPSINQQPSFFEQQIQALRAGSACRLFRDEWRSPLSLETAARGLLTAAAADITGLLHLGGVERMSRLEMGQRLARVLNVDQELCQAIGREDVATEEPRPQDTSLASEKWQQTFTDFARPNYEESLQSLGL